MIIFLQNWETEKKLQIIFTFYYEDTNATQKLKTYKSSPLKALSNHIQFFLSNYFFILFLRETINTSDFNIYDCNPLSKRTISCFLEKTKLYFFYSSGKCLIWFFSSRLNIFTSKISNLLLPLGPRARGLESRYTNEYINDAFLIYIIVAVAFPFLVLQRT